MLLAFDLDGTIVTGDNRILPETVDAIEKARERGHHITVITGRTETSSRRHLEALGVLEHFSTDHGGQVIGVGGALSFAAPLDVQLVHSLVEQYGDDPAVEIGLAVDDKLFIHNVSAQSRSWSAQHGHTIAPFSEYTDLPTPKFRLACSRGVRDIYEALLESHPQLTYYVWDDAIEIVGAGGHKGAALERLARIHGVAQRDTVAFGDNFNDIEMMRWAGTAVAVGEDAHPEVIALADAHVDSPEEHGVAEWIVAHLL